MGAKLGSGGGPMADINVTPLIDVVLVLLVVFMVITPMLQSGQPVDLPVSTQSETVNDVGQFVVVSVTEGNGVWVEQEQVEVDATSIIPAIGRELARNPTRRVLIKADKDLPYAEVRQVMDVLAENRITSILVAAAKE